MITKQELHGEAMEKFVKDRWDSDSLFVLEDYLTGLPVDWMDCVSFIMAEGFNEAAGQGGCLILDDEASARLFRLLAKERIELFVIGKNDKDKQRRIWMLALEKIVKEGGDPEMTLIGGENLRSFCDDRDIFYRSVKTSDGKLLSATNLKYLKELNEDCRKPLNE